MCCVVMHLLLCLGCVEVEEVPGMKLIIGCLGQEAPHPRTRADGNRLGGPPAEAVPHTMKFARMSLGIPHMSDGTPEARTIP